MTFAQLLPSLLMLASPIEGITPAQLLPTALTLASTLVAVTIAFQKLIATVAATEARLMKEIALVRSELHELRQKVRGIPGDANGGMAEDIKDINSEQDEMKKEAVAEHNAQEKYGTAYSRNEIEGLKRQNKGEEK